MRTVFADENRPSCFHGQQSRSDDIHSTDCTCLRYAYNTAVVLALRGYTSTTTRYDSAVGAAHHRWFVIARPIPRAVPLAESPPGASVHRRYGSRLAGVMKALWC